MSYPPPAMNSRERCEAHFRARCAEREIPLSVDRICEMMRRLKPCWRREGAVRHIVSVRFKRGFLARVVWDAELEAPVTAWWHARDACDVQEVRECRGGGSGLVEIAERGV